MSGQQLSAYIESHPCVHVPGLVAGVQGALSAHLPEVRPLSQHLEPVTTHCSACTTTGWALGYVGQGCARLVSCDTDRDHICER